MTRGLVVMVVCFTSSVACADAIDDAMAQLEVGEIDDARARLDAVTIRDRATLVRLLEARARVAHATRDEERMGEALRALDALEPDHAFGSAVPPELAERLGAMDTPRLSLSVTGAEIGTGLSLVVRVDDAVGLSRETRLYVRVDGQTLETNERSFAVPLEQGGRAEVWAELRGEGGVVLERWGSAESPNPIVRTASQLGDVDPNPGFSVQENTQTDTEDPRARRKRIIIGVVVAVVIAGAAAGAGSAIYYTKNNRDARLGQPVLR